MISTDVYQLSKNIERLRNNISKETPASEKTMLERLDDIEKGIEVKIETIKQHYANDIQKLKELLNEQDDKIENLTQLNEDARSVLSLYTALMDIAQCGGNDNVRLQSIKTIGYIVASYASKDNENKCLKEMD